MVVPNERVIRGIPELLRPDQKVATSVAKAVDVEFRKQVAEQFATEGAHGGSPWFPLSPAYKAAKDRLFSGAIDLNKSIAAARGKRLSKGVINKILGAENKILQLTGRMRRAFTRKDDRDHVAYGYVSKKSELRTVHGAQGEAYFAYHQDGGKQSGRPPQRPIVSVTQSQLVLFRKAAVNAMIPHVKARVRALAKFQARLSARSR